MKMCEGRRVSRREGWLERGFCSCRKAAQGGSWSVECGQCTALSLSLCEGFALTHSNARPVPFSPVASPHSSTLSSAATVVSWPQSVAVCCLVIASLSVALAQSGTKQLIVCLCFSFSKAVQVRDP